MIKIPVKFTYLEDYLPTKRHKIPQKREKSGKLTVKLPEISENDAPIAFIEMSGDKPCKEYRWYNKKLWCKTFYKDICCTDDKNRLYSKQELITKIETPCSWTFDDKAEAQAKYKEYSRYLIIDGIVYQKKGEPRYVVMTFGLGHNHGGTGLSVTEWYNPNVRKSRYFNALERNAAIELAKQTAIGRGDTEYLDFIGYSGIKVLIPEAVKCKPKKQHGNGNDFINQLESLVTNSGSTLEAAALITAVTAKKITGG